MSNLDYETDMNTLNNTIFRLSRIDDSRLQTVLPTLLPNILLYLSKDSEEIRDLSIQILNHINSRIRSSESSVVLPVSLLVTLFIEYSSKQKLWFRYIDMFETYTLMFIEKGLLQLTITSEKLVYIKQLLNSLSVPGATEKRCARSIMFIFIDHIGIFSKEINDIVQSNPTIFHTSSGISILRKKTMKILNHGSTRNYFLDTFLDIILLETENNQWAHSQATYDSITKQGSKFQEYVQLGNVQEDILLLLISGIFSPEEIYVHLLVGSVNSHDHVCQKSQDGLRRLGKPKLDDHPAIIEKLMNLYLGGDRKCSSGPLKVKILSELTKSESAPKMIPQSFKLILDSVFGKTTFLRLQVSGIHFLNQCIPSLKPSMQFSKIIFANLLKKLATLPLNSTNQPLRSLLYEPLSIIVLQCPTLINTGLKLPQFYFQRFENEQTEPIKMNIEKSIENISKSYEESTPDIKYQINVLLLDNIENSTDSHVRISSLRWLVDRYSFSDSKIRFICCLFSQDSNPRLSEMAKRGLIPRIAPPTSDAAAILEPYPDFEEFLEYSNQYLLDHPDINQRSGIYMTIIQFLKKCLSYTQQTSASIVSPSSLELYLHMVLSSFDSLKFSSSCSQLHTTASFLLFNLFEFCIEQSINIGISSLDMNNPRRILLGPRNEPRLDLAKSFGLRSACSTSDSVSKEVQSFLEILVQDTYRTGLDPGPLIGSILACGTIISHSFLRLDMSLTCQVVQAIIFYLGHSNLMICSSAAQSLGMIFQKISISKLLHFEFLKDVSMFPLGVFDCLNTISRILLQTKRRNEHGSVENCLDSLWMISEGINQRYSSHLEEITPQELSLMSEIVSLMLSELISSSNSTNDEEILLTIGETISKVSLSSLPYCRKDSDTFSSWIEYVVKSIVRTAIVDGSKVSMSAGCIWFVSLVKYTCHTDELKPLLGEIQDNFVVLLGQEKVVTREFAAKGMALLFEMSDPITRSRLLEKLLNRISKSTHSNEQLKYFITVAKDLGHPKILYKLLDLGNEHKVWNTPRGITYRLESLQLIKGDISRKMEVLVPKIFRYRFDPNPVIKSTMKSLWLTLTSDTEGKLLTTKYFTFIIDELISSASSRNYHIRECSGGALAEIIDGCAFSKISSYLPTLWLTMFNLLDDIQDSVRICSIGFAKRMISQSERFCDPSRSISSSSQEISQAIDITVPLILEKGVNHKAKEIQALSVHCILQISKNSGEHLGSHTVDIIGSFLETLSSIEPAELSYAMFHTESLNMSTEQLEAMRLSAARSSPISSAIDHCLDSIDFDHLPDLISRILGIVKTGVGLASLDGCVRVVRFTIGKFKEQMKPFCKNMIYTFHRGLFDRSATIQKLYSSVLGKICSISKVKLVQDLVENILTEYETDDDGSRRICIQCLLDISVGLGEIPVELCSTMIPFLFLARNDSDQQIRSLSTKLISELPSGLEANSKKSFPFILTKFEALLNTPVFKIRRACFLSLEQLFRLQVSPENSQQVWNLVLSLASMVDSPYWDGKEALLFCIVELCSHTKSFIQADRSQNFSRSFCLSFLHASSSRPVSYQIAALTCLGTFLHTFPSYKTLIFETPLTRSLFTGLIYFDSEADQNDMAEADGNSESFKKSSRKLLVGSFTALGMIWPGNESQVETGVEDALVESIQIENIGWVSALIRSGILGHHFEIRVSALQCLSTVIRSMKGRNSFFQQIDIQGIYQSVVLCTSDSKHASVRCASLDVLSSLFETKQGLSLISSHMNEIEEISRILSDDAHSSVAMNARKLVGSIQSQFK